MRKRRRPGLTHPACVESHENRFRVRNRERVEPVFSYRQEMGLGLQRQVASREPAANDCTLAVDTRLCVSLRSSSRISHIFYLKVDSWIFWTFSPGHCFDVPLVSAGTSVPVSREEHVIWIALGDDFRFSSRIQRHWLANGYTRPRQSTELMAEFHMVWRSCPHCCGKHALVCGYGEFKDCAYEAETCTHSANCALRRDSRVAVLVLVLDAPVVVQRLVHFLYHSCLHGRRGGGARRRQRQWYVHGWFCWYDAIGAVLPASVGRPKLLGTMVGMDQKDNCSDVVVRQC